MEKSTQFDWNRLNQTIPTEKRHKFEPETQATLDKIRLQWLELSDELLGEVRRGSSISCIAVDSSRQLKSLK